MTARPSRRVSETLADSLRTRVPSDGLISLLESPERTPSSLWLMLAAIEKHAADLHIGVIRRVLTRCQQAHFDLPDETWAAGTPEGHAVVAMAPELARRVIPALAVSFVRRESPL